MLSNKRYTYCTLFWLPIEQEIYMFCSFIEEHDVYVCSLNTTSTAYAKHIMFILIIYVIHIHLDTCIVFLFTEKQIDISFEIVMK